MAWPPPKIALKRIDREIYIQQHPCQLLIAYVRQAEPDVIQINSYTVCVTN